MIIRFDVYDQRLIKGIETLDPEDILLSFDQLNQRQGDGIWTVGGACGKDPYNGQFRFSAWMDLQSDPLGFRHLV